MINRKKVINAENLASGHADYAAKLRIYATELTKNYEDNKIRRYSATTAQT